MYRDAISAPSNYPTRSRARTHMQRCHRNMYDTYKIICGVREINCETGFVVVPGQHSVCRQSRGLKPEPRCRDSLLACYFFRRGEYNLPSGLIEDYSVSVNVVQSVCEAREVKLLFFNKLAPETIFTYILQKTTYLLTLKNLSNF